MIFQATPDDNRVWDICIVGSGPVGMAMALEFDRLGREVLVLESGGPELDPKRKEDSRAIIADSRRHVPMEIATCRALGGTSWTWGGRCIPFDDIDLAQRSWVPDAHWPIAHDELRPWYARASEYLQCGTDQFEAAPAHLKSLPPEVSAASLERWATESRIALIHRKSLEASRRIHISLNTTVVGLVFDAAQRTVLGVETRSQAGAGVIRARRVVLALGGVETTRLLLAVQRRHPQLFGGLNGPLGRYYMGHISGKIADIVFDRPDSADDFDFFRDSSGAFVRRRFTLTPAAQSKHQLLNTAFWPDNPPFHDYRHKSGVLSGVFLVLSFPPTGRIVLPEGVRIAHIGAKPRHYGRHLLNLLVGAPAGAKDIVRILRGRFIAKPRKPGFLIRNSGGKYALHYHGEQEPNPESRITLADETDRFGLPRARIDLRFTPGDVRSVLASHRVLDEALRESRVGRLEYRYSQDDLPARVMDQAADGYHQTGTTRMGTDPRCSVVDPNLRTHGLENLYVASSSIFPTTGQANSTYPAVAFGVRLAHHLHASTPANTPG